MPGTRRRLSADVRREQILETAAELFIQDGFENVKMSDIAERLETSRPNIYTYYPSTEAILKVVLDRHAKEYLDAISKAISESPNVLSVEDVIRIMREHSNLFMLLSSGGGPTFRKHRKIVDDAMDAYAMKFISVTDDDPEHQNAEAVVTLMRLLMTTVVVQNVLHPERFDLGQLSQLADKMLQTGYSAALKDPEGRMKRYLSTVRQSV